MFSILTSWMKPKTTRRTAQRIKPKSTRATLGLMTMEAREVPAVLHSDLVNAFNAGANVARDVSNAAQVVSVFGSDIPVIKENIAPVANLADQFSKAFAKLDEATAIVSPTAVIAGVDAEFQKVAKQIQDTVPGTVVTRFSLTPDANGDLVHINYKATKQINLPSFSAGGDTNGFAFFDGAVNGKIEGSLTSSKTANVGLDVVYGVDLVNGVPTFYVAEGSKLGLEKFNITGDTKGTLAIRSLANVTVSGKLDANLQGNVTLVDTKDGVLDHRVRVSALAASAKGDLTGTSVTLGTTASPIKFEARVPVLGSITWTGQFAGGFNGTSFKVDGANTKLNAPDPLMVLKQAVKGVLGSFAGDNLSLLSGDFKGTLGKKLEDLRNIDILSELGLSSDKFAFSNNSSQIDSKSTLQAIKDALPPEFKLLPGKDLTMENLKTAVDKLINGEYVDLVSYTLTKEFTPLQASQALPAVTFPILPFLQGKFNLSLEEKAGVKVFVGVGFDTTGLYIDPRTSLSLNGSIQLSAEAAVTLFGLAGVSLDVNGGVGLDAGIKINDPDPSDGKVYLDELIDLASNATSVASGITNSMSFFAKANLTGGVRAELDLPFPLPDVTLLEKKFTLSSLFSTASDKTVQSTTGKATFRTVPLFPNSKLDVDALINSAGVLTINAASDPTGGNVQLSQVDGKVKVVWSSQGAGTATKAVNKVIFLGSALADRLETSESFNIPIDAKGFDGNDQLTGGLMADVLDGGNGADILIGNGGSDTLKAGTGFNTVRGGDGDDLITAGNDGNAIFGNDGNDNISSGDGADEIEGGQGNDIINAGNGNNVVFGGDGADRITAGTGKDILDGGLGNDIIDAGDGADLLIGGDGADTLRGQAGNDRLLGDAGADRLEGGAGDDILRGGADNDFLIGNAGDDIISGGTGQDTEFGDDEAMNGLEIGRDSFEIDFKDADSLKDILRGGPERDVITISGAVNEVTNVELADDILIAPGSVPGEFSVGRRDVGATGPRQTVFFQIPTDIDGVVIRGGGGDDRIEVTESLTTPISVDGGLGNDIILGGGGNDKLYGNAGNDTIDGRGGNDEIYGDGDNGIATIPIVKVESGEGNDTLFGGAGVDLIYGNGGTDRIDGGLLQDFIHGGKGSDIILNTGDNHGDQIFGDEDADVIVGGIGRDIIKGGSGNDTILGGAGGDIIDGEEGDDTIVGETGRDIINGGAGDDNLKAFLDNDLRSSLNTVYKLTLQALTMPTTDAEAVALTPPLQAQMTAVLKQKLQLQSQSTVGLTQEQIDARNAELTRLEDLVKDIASQIDDLLFYASQGNDTLNGDAGKDTLTGSPFNDILNGGADDDTLIQSDLSRFGGDIFNGDAGNDVFVMFGTPLADAITFKQGRDKNGVLIDGAIDVFGNGGTPIGSFGNGAKAAFLGIENIRVNLGDGDDTVDFSGLGLKVPLPAGGTIQVDGGNGNDIINAAGYNGATMLLGGNGNDIITGGLVNDVIQGGDGNDRIDGGTGNDTIYGDLIDGGIGNDTIFGGAGNDSIFAGAGDDTVEADPSLGNPGSGNDTVFGGDGNDTITAGFGSDYVDGGAGDDRIYGDTSPTAAGTATDPDKDTLVGGLGADTLFGSGGADFLVGNTTTGVSDGSIDFLDGGIGNDTAQVSYIGVKEQFVGIEKLDVVKPATTNILVRNDFTIVAVEANGNVYVGGVLSSDHAINVQFSPDRKVIYIQSSSNSLIGFTASGKRTVMMTGIDFFEVQTDGRIKVTFPEVINPKTREGKVPTQILLGLTQ